MVTLLKITLLHGYLSRFLNSANGTKPQKASHFLYSLIWLNIKTSKIAVVSFEKHLADIYFFDINDIITSFFPIGFSVSVLTLFAIGLFSANKKESGRFAFFHKICQICPTINKLWHSFILFWGAVKYIQTLWLALLFLLTIKLFIMTYFDDNCDLSNIATKWWKHCWCPMVCWFPPILIRAAQCGFVV